MTDVTKTMTRHLLGSGTTPSDGTVTAFLELDTGAPGREGTCVWDTALRSRRP
jgi:hypothetical protein